jgi:hypothetical protein
MPKRSPLFKKSLERAWYKTKDGFDWKALMKSLAAAAAGAALAVLGLTSESSSKIVAVLLAGLLAAAFSLLLSFLSNLVGAPKDIRRGFVVPAGKFGSAAIGTLKVRASDIMQQEAGAIFRMIDRYLQLQGRDRHPKVMERVLEEVRQYIKYFGERAANDPWITRKSRKRSLRLFEEISGSEDLDFIQRRCREFVEKRPSF